MVNPLLIIFKKYLSSPAAKGGLGSPVSIRASDLDNNFQALTLIPSEKAVYDTNYSKLGTELIFKANEMNAKWIELDVCVSGVPKKIMVLATDPY